MENYLIELNPKKYFFTSEYYSIIKLSSEYYKKVLTGTKIYVRTDNIKIEVIDREGFGIFYVI